MHLSTWEPSFERASLSGVWSCTLEVSRSTSLVIRPDNARFAAENHCESTCPSDIRRLNFDGTCLIIRSTHNEHSLRALAPRQLRRYYANDFDTPTYTFTYHYRNMPNLPLPEDVCKKSLKCSARGYVVIRAFSQWDALSFSSSFFSFCSFFCILHHKIVHPRTYVPRTYVQRRIIETLHFLLPRSSYLLDFLSG